MDFRSPARVARRIALVLSALASVGALPGVAAAAGNIYWSDYGYRFPTPQTAHIMFGSLSGEGASKALFSEAPEEISGKQEIVGISGVVLDPATGKLYWADTKNGKIQSANLSGEGSPLTLYHEGTNEPQGLTIDAATGKLYWTDGKTGEIRAGSLSGEGASQTLYTEQPTPYPGGLAVVPSTGKLYWTDTASGKIRVGNVSGEGVPQTLYTEASGEPVGIAIDEATSKLYWVDNGPNVTGEVVVGGLEGGAKVHAQRLYVEESDSDAWGLAIDPQTSKLYWGDLESGLIRVGGFGGKEEVEAKTLFKEEPSDEPSFPALLLAPAAAGAPTISGGGTVGQALACSQGSWAADMPEGVLYQAPQSFAYQWLRGGAPVAGANAASFTPTEGGSYTCQVTASNAAGATTQTSAATTVPPIVCAVAAVDPLCPCDASCPYRRSELTIVTHGKLLVKAGKVKVAIACSKGVGNCEGELSLVTRFSHSEPPRHGRRHTRLNTLPALTFAHVRYSLAAGKRETIVLKIDAKGKRLLAKAKGHKLKVWLVATDDVGGRKRSGRGVTLALPSSHKHHKNHKSHKR